MPETMTKKTACIASPVPKLICVIGEGLGFRV